MELRLAGGSSVLEVEIGALLAIAKRVVKWRVKTTREVDCKSGRSECDSDCSCSLFKRSGIFYFR